MALEQLHVIYALIDPRTNEVRYVGQTRNAEERFRKHRLAQTHGVLQEWERELRDAGLEPGWRVLEKDVQPDEVDGREIHWIAKGDVDGWPLLNVMAGGNGWNWREVPEWVREKIAGTMRERWQDPEFHDEQVRKMTEGLADPKVRARLSEHARERVMDEKTRAKIAETVAALWEDPEYRARQSASHFESSARMWQDPSFRERRREQMNSEEARAKTGAATRRMWQDPETRARLTEERRTRGPLSEEHKRKIREGVKRNWEKRKRREQANERSASS